MKKYEDINVYGCVYVNGKMYNDDQILQLVPQTIEAWHAWQDHFGYAGPCDTSSQNELLKNQWVFVGDQGFTETNILVGEHLVFDDLNAFILFMGKLDRTPTVYEYFYRAFKQFPIDDIWTDFCELPALDMPTLSNCGLSCVDLIDTAKRLLMLLDANTPKYRETIIEACEDTCLLYICG